LKEERILSMKLVCYDVGTGPRAGVLEKDVIVDVTAIMDMNQTIADVQALLELADDSAEAPLDRLREQLVSGFAPPGIPLSAARLRAPILQPPTVRDFFAYEGHASAGGTRELADAWYRLPIFYFSNPLRIFGPDDDVPYPSASNLLDYELEIGCVIGKGGTNIREADGLSHIAGFMIFNDWSARDLQFDEMTALLGPAKGKDGATSIGPWIVTTDELAPFLKDGRLHLQCRLRVNGELWMDAPAGGMYHSWGSFVERASRDSRIAPGDIFGSGTVSGGTISEARRNGVDARYLQPGDMVAMEVEGIGILRNRVGEKVDPDPDYRFGPPARKK